MRTKVLCLCIALFAIASCSHLHASPIATFTLIQPLDFNPPGSTHFDQIITFDLPDGGPVGGFSMPGFFLIQTSANVHIEDTNASGPPTHQADVFANLQFSIDGVNVSQTTFLGFPFIDFTYGSLEDFFNGPVTAPLFVPGFYPSLLSTGGNSVRVDVTNVPELATLITLGSGLIGLVRLGTCRPHKSIRA
jgi:hypothetical protein